MIWTLSHVALGDKIGASARQLATVGGARLFGKALIPGALA